MNVEVIFQHFIMSKLPTVAQKLPKHVKKSKYLAIQGADAFYWANAAVNIHRPNKAWIKTKPKVDHKGKVFTHVLTQMVR